MRGSHLQRRRPALASLAGLVVALAASCSTQRWPAPMDPSVVPLPPGDGASVAPGLEEVEVIRHADPVQFRRAGANAAFPMRFWNKKERARAGAWVLTDSGGRAELLWPRDGTNVILFEDGAAQLGERDRDEPVARLRRISRVKLQLGPDALIELEGGALLSGDPEELCGPYVIERLPIGDILRFYNKARHTARIEYRDEVLTVGPGQVVDLPILGLGTEPFRRSSLEQVVRTDGVDLRLLGDVSVDANGGVATVEASGSGRVEAQGVQVALESGQVARFTDLSGRVTDSPVALQAPTPVPVESMEIEDPSPEAAASEGGVSAADPAAPPIPASEPARTTPVEELSTAHPAASTEEATEVLEDPAPSDPANNPSGPQSGGRA